ncbi:MAG TPA: hypothetical protein VEZ70_14395 [Allosphingosinicella sp.]|nr:hypothetical protein [Allosphingosinicella sp.]
MAGGALPGLVELGIAATSPRDEAFARYARIDPEGAMKARRYEREERHGDVKLSREEIQRHSDINDEQLQILGGVTDQATWDAARAAQARLAQRFGIDPDDVDDLPEVYSPQFVESVRLSALGAKERVDALRNNRKLDWDIEDDEHDNRRADRETDSRITYRSASLDDRRERTRIAREKPVRQPAAARERPPSKSSVVGGILAKQARGERLSPSEQGVLDQHGGVKYPDGTVVEMPNGDTKVVRNGRLVSE